MGHQKSLILVTHPPIFCNVLKTAWQVLKGSETKQASMHLIASGNSSNYVLFSGKTSLRHFHLVWLTIPILVQILLPPLDVDDVVCAASERKLSFFYTSVNMGTVLHSGGCIDIIEWLGSSVQKSGN